MGYRSDVRIITSKKGFNELEKYITKYLKGKNDWNLLHQLDVDNSNDYERYFGWNSVKWYENSEGFEDVDAVMSGLQHLEEKDLSYRYARMGESYGDYEEKEL
jgi:histidyl-tRNA synthetase